MSANADQVGVATANLWADITREIHDFSPRPVGFGGYSDIYTATWRSNDGDMKVAVKVIRAAPTPSKTGELPRTLRREISVWKRLLHPNIHVLCGFYEGFGSAPALVSPWYENGNINEYTRQRAADPDIGLLKLKLLADVATGLKFLHENHIVHGDIKGGNVLISDDGVARLCDFGLSRLLLEHSQSTTTTGGKGTSRWMAPELLLVDGAHHSYETDIWACGCLFIEVLSSVVPYHDKVNNHQVILALSRREPPGRPSDLPDAIWTIVQRCCDFDVVHRPSPAHVLAVIDLYLVMQRVHPMVTLGRPMDSAESETLTEIETSLKAAEPYRLSKLYILTDAELATEVVRLFALWSLSPGHFGQLRQAIFQWCLHKFGSGNLHLPAGVYLPSVEDDDFFGKFSASHEPGKLRPLARLVERAHPGMAKHLMTLFATPALRYPLQLYRRASSVAWLPDGLRVVVGCFERDLRILDVATGVTLREIVEHTRKVYHVAVSPSGKLLVSCSGDRSIRLWDAETGLAIGTPMLGHTRGVWSVALSPDNQHIVSGSEDHTIRVWSIETCATVLVPLRGHTSSVGSVAFSPDGSRIVSASRDTTVRIWDARTGDPIMTLFGHNHWVDSVAYSPDGSRIVSGSHDCTIRIWDTATGQLVGSALEGHSDCTSVAYSPDGTRVISGFTDGTIGIWDATTGASVATIRGHRGEVCFVAFSLDGKRLASTSDDATVRIWDATDDWLRWNI